MKLTGFISEETDRGLTLEKKAKKKKEPPFSAIMRFRDLNGGFWS